MAAQGSWETKITLVEPDNLQIAGYPLQDLIERKTLLDTIYLLVTGELPSEEKIETLNKIAFTASQLPCEKLLQLKGEDISKTLVKYLLIDEYIPQKAQNSIEQRVEKTVFTIGRFARYLASILDNDVILDNAKGDEPFCNIIYRAITGKSELDEHKAEILEAMIVASVDHGVTPPSAQATLIASTTRSAYEVAVSHGIGAITDVHGGAGQKAALFFVDCAHYANNVEKSFENAVADKVNEVVVSKKRISGMGHRVHKNDPRRDILWQKAAQLNLAGDHVYISTIITDIFEQVKGRRLPINVDGVIGAIVADLNLDPSIAKALFIYGRVAGLSAHYFEEILTQPPMRRINFSDAKYTGEKDKSL